jgi:hypothetical protein
MLFSRIGLAALAIALTSFSVLAGGADRPLAHAPFDPQARQVDLFAALDDGTLEVQLVAKDSAGGNLFLKNTTKVPLTVKMPESFVGIPIHAQGFFGPPFGNPAGGNNPGSNSQMSSNGSGSQSVGAGASNQNMNQNANINNPFGNNSPFGPSFFSIPAERTLRVPYRSVCLDHGLQDHGPRSRYTIIPTEKYTDDPILQTLINHVGSSNVDQHVAQAAAWNIANGMTWDELRSKWKGPIANVGARYFSSRDIAAAKELVSQIQSAAPKQPDKGRLSRSVITAGR